MRYKHFLFDLDDTLLDFRSSERLSFERTMDQLGLSGLPAALYADYRRESAALWAEFEAGRITRDCLRVERFRRAFDLHGVAADPGRASALYLDILPETVVLIDGAQQLCETLAQGAELGVITNGIESMQRRRLAASGLSPHFAFLATSETCGFAKPDVRFFTYACEGFRDFRKSAAILIGDRLEADIAGAMQFGIDSCWFNPAGLPAGDRHVPTLEISHLTQIHGRLCA